MHFPSREFQIFITYTQMNFIIFRMMRNFCVVLLPLSQNSKLPTYVQSFERNFCYYRCEHAGRIWRRIIYSLNLSHNYSSGSFFFCLSGFVCRSTITLRTEMCRLWLSAKMLCGKVAICGLLPSLKKPSGKLFFTSVLAANDIRKTNILKVYSVSHEFEADCV